MQEITNQEQLSFLELNTPEEKSQTKEKEVEVKLAVDPAELAPMMQQYVNLKKQYPEHVLLFQVGDFYEIFFEDAPKVSQAINIRLTSRDKQQENSIPMCGIPVSTLDNYLPKLLQAGFSCVVVSQNEDSKNKKGMVQREISRIITPGVRFEGDGLDERKFNFLAAIYFNKRGTGAISFVDVSTAWLRVLELEVEEDLLEALQRIRPVEVVLPLSVAGIAQEKTESWIKIVKKAAEHLNFKLTWRPYVEFKKHELSERLKKLLSLDKNFSEVLSKQLLQLEELSLESLQALQSVFDYVDEVSFGNVPKLSQFNVDHPSQAVMLDAATRRNLEITETRIDGDKRNSLLGQIDYCKTAMGSRLFAEWILSPSRDLEEIVQRLDVVDCFCQSVEELTLLRQLLLAVRDIDRLCSRITGNRAVPRDLASLRDSIQVFPEIKKVISKLKAPLLETLSSEFDDLLDIYQKLSSSLLEDPPLRLNEGSIFKEGFNSEVDRLRNISTEGGKWLIELEQRERKNSGISNLKIKYNNVFGYFIEISKGNSAKAPSNYERKQTLVNAERFVIPELKEFEVEQLSAKARQYELEKELFVQLRTWVAEQAIRVQRSAKCLAMFDVLAAFGYLALEHNFSRPIILEDNTTKITQGRHVVIEQVIGAHNFIANDVLLDTQKRRFAVLTGPNMGGKSTYLRQLGIIQLLAQAGSFVPAKEAKLGLVDRIFTRIGAADDLARGDSTFMVEMREAGTILTKATEKSLVLIDEIGRGTATQDGLAIATAIAEYLHDVTKCRTVFATHFHELTELAMTKEGAFCLSVGIVERDLEIIFTHRIEEKAADRSYGVEVARLAGLPELVLKRATVLLRQLITAEKDTKRSPVKMKQEVLEVKEDSQVVRQLAEYEKIIKQIQDIKLETLTPIQALVELDQIKKQCAKKS